MKTETMLLAEPAFTKRSTFSTPTRAILLSACYVIGGLLGSESSALMGGDVPLVWAPSGIALAAILLFGYRMWWGVALGACLFVFVQGTPGGFFTLATAVGNTVGAVLCAYLLERLVQFQYSMARVKYVTGFILLACLLGTTVNAAFNVVGLCYNGAMPLEHLMWKQVFGAIIVWWVPNAMGALVVTPMILAWAAPTAGKWNTPRLVEAACCGIGLLAGTQLSFNSWFVYGVENYPLAYLPYPFLVWGALRFGLRGATSGTFVVAALSIYELLHQQGPFWAGKGHEQTSLMLIGCYLGVVAVGNLLLAAAAIERGVAVRATIESEKRYRGVVEDQTDLICRFTPDGTLVFVNQAYCRFHGRSREELLGSNYFQSLPPLDREIPLSQFADLTPEEPIQMFDNKVVAGPNQYIWQQCSIRGLFDEDNRLVEFQAVMQDITRRKQSEEALRQGEERLHAILHSMPDGVIVLDDCGAITLFNTAAEKIFQRKAAHAMVHPVEQLIAPDDRARFREHRARQAGGAGLTVLELAGLRPDGTTLPIDVAASEISRGDGTHLTIVAVRDITARKTLEEQYRQSQKMEAVGRLAGGIAHDFNNLMQAILGYINILDRRLPLGDPSHEAVEQIQKSLEHATSLTRQLLAFSRKQVLTPALLPVNRAVKDMSQLLQRLLGEHIELKLTLADPAPWIKADAGQIEQIILNLAINARDAMPGGGTLAVQTGNVEFLEETAVSSGKLPAGSYATLKISDSGCGMSVDVRAHLFEPFFTTKETGKGTGLGLSNVYGVVKQSGGEIHVHSVEERGTTFEIYLPRFSAGTEPAAQPPLPPPAQGTESVLVVEDEELVRLMLLEVLKMANYHVLEARNGAEALEVAERFDGTLNLLVTDLTMPGISGAELARRLAIARPELRVLFISGYSDVEAADLNKVSYDGQFLQKPFHPHAFLAKTRQILDGKPAESALA